MEQVSLSSLIETGRDIKKGLEFIEPSPRVIRTFSVFRLANQDQYYSWKEYVIKFLQTYSKEDVNRFVQYAEEFEKCYVPHYISNMIGILEACKAFPSKQMKALQEVDSRVAEMDIVIQMEQLYIEIIDTDKDAVNSKAAISAFHRWHAAASVLFDKWFYSTEEDWIKFQDIEGVGNGYTLKSEYNKIYTPYKKLMARLKDGRNIKMSHVNPKSTNTAKKVTSKKISIFISYSHSDKKWLERLQKHLKVLSKYFESVDYWDDTKIKGGDKWKKEIEEAIAKANVAILLVSTDFLSSDFITTDELPPLLRKAEEEGTTILPLIVSPCAFTMSEISDFQAVNSPEKTLADWGSDEAAIERTYLEVIKCIQELF
jgi:hypothetical protein